MKIKKLLFASMLLPFTVFAQDNWCGTDDLHEQMLSENENYAHIIAQQNKKWSEFATNSQKTVSSVFNQDEDVYEIPVVFHIIHTGQPVGAPENPENQVIVDLVEELNQKFSATWPVFPGVSEGGVDVPIQFKLAQRDPDCQPTNGINRVDGSFLPSYIEFGVARPGNPGTQDIILKGVSRWTNTDYLNIWIVTKITGNAVNGNGVAGYATYPGASSGVDGVVLRYDQLSWAITHEVGHFLGLRHTFEGTSDSVNCPPNGDCTVDGDLVCDTDPHFLLSGCPTGINTCTGNSLVPIVYNIMNYTSCPDRFTEGQKERMLYMLLNERTSLLTSYGAIPVETEIDVVDVPTPASCEPLGIVYEGNNKMIGTFQVKLANLNIRSSNFNTDNQYYYDFTDHMCINSENVAYMMIDESYTLTVITSPLSNYTTNVRGWIDFNNDGFFDNEELVMTSYGENVSYGNHSVSFIVPSSATVNTSLRMRISTDFHESPEPQSCGMIEYGQVEDYTVYISPNVSVQDIKQIKLELYPNPTSDILNLSEKVNNIEIYATDGRKVMSFESAEQINVSSLSSGTYIIKAINSANKKAQGTFIKK